LQYVSATAAGRHALLRTGAVAFALSALAAAALAQVATPTVQMQTHSAPILEPQYVVETRTVWEGRDVDGDGASDFVNPTGEAPRAHDTYGEGQFGASRDGGSRDHEGVDYRGAAGSVAIAPISGMVTGIGQAYGDTPNLKYVEITNAALGFEARVFYVNPDVAIGDPIKIGAPLGKIADLSRRYPGGMTNHVHLELKDPSGRRIDATRVITARRETVRVPV